MEKLGLRIGCLIALDLWGLILPVFLSGFKENRRGMSNPVNKSKTFKFTAEEALAVAIGQKYVVFWDDEEDSWKNQIGLLYGNKPTISIQEAEDQIV